MRVLHHGPIRMISLRVLPACEGGYSRSRKRFSAGNKSAVAAVSLRIEVTLLDAVHPPYLGPHPGISPSCGLDGDLRQHDGFGEKAPIRWQNDLFARDATIGDRCPKPTLRIT